MRGGFAGPLHLDPLLTRAFEEHPLLQSRQFGQWHVDRQARRRAESFEHRAAQHAAIGPVEARPEVEGPRAERERGVANQRLVLDAGPRAEAVTGGTPAERTVERKLPRLERLESPAARRTREPATVHLHRPVGLINTLDRPRHEHRARARIKSRLHALGQPASLCRTGRHAVDHDLDLVFPLAVERGRFIELLRLAINPHAGIPRRAKPRKKSLGRLAHAELHRREQQEPRAGLVLEQPLDGLVDALRPNRRAAFRAVHHAQPGRQHAEVVVHLRERADRRPRRAPRRPLLDGDRRRQALDLFKDRFRHLAHELPGIGREALDIPPLPFGIERVEGERGFPRAARAAADRHRAAGNVGIDRFQVVLRRAADRDLWWARIDRCLFDLRQLGEFGLGERGRRGGLLATGRQLLHAVGPRLGSREHGFQGQPGV